MGLFGWLKRQPVDTRTRAWREAWTAAVTTRDAGAIASLEAALRQQPPLADDLEIEEEMLDGLRQLVAIERELADARLPVVETSHDEGNCSITGGYVYRGKRIPALRGAYLY